MHRKVDVEDVHYPTRPRAHDDDPVGEVDRFGDGVGDEHDRRSGFPPDAVQFDVHLLASESVQCSERLVHEQHFRLVQQCAAQGYALLHTAGQLVGESSLEARQTGHLDELIDPLQVWILSEFVRYLTHPKSGATEFVDMGRHWVAVRDSVTAGTLRSGDVKALSVANTWASLSRHLALRMTADLGVPVKHHLPRKFSGDPQARNEYIVEQLVASGCLSATLRIPDAAGDVTVEADLRTNKIQCSTAIDAPTDGTALRRASWLLKQLKNAPADILVEAVFADPGEISCENLATVRSDTKSLTAGRISELQYFTLTSPTKMGSKRSGSAASFIGSVTDGLDAFYRDVVQPLKPWVPSAPESVSIDLNRF